MPVPVSTLRASIMVALKQVSKPVRDGFKSPSWLEREDAEQAIAQSIIEALGGFDIEQKPPVIPIARSMEPDMDISASSGRCSDR